MEIFQQALQFIFTHAEISFNWLEKLNIAYYNMHTHTYFCFNIQYNKVVSTPLNCPLLYNGTWFLMCMAGA